MWLAQIELNPSEIAKFGEVVIIALVALVLTYALLTLVRGRNTTDTQDGEIMKRLIDQNQRSLDLFEELKEGRTATQDAVKRYAEENQETLKTFTGAFNLLVKSITDYHDLNKSTTDLVQGGIEEQDKKLQALGNRVSDIAAIAVEVPEVHKRIEDNTLTIIRLAEEIKAAIEDDTGEVIPIDPPIDLPKAV